MNVQNVQANQATPYVQSYKGVTKEVKTEAPKSEGFHWMEGVGGLALGATIAGGIAYARKGKAPEGAKKVIDDFSRTLDDMISKRPKKETVVEHRKAAQDARKNFKEEAGKLQGDNLTKFNEAQKGVKTAKAELTAFDKVAKAASDADKELTKAIETADTAAKNTELADALKVVKQGDKADGYADSLAKLNANDDVKKALEKYTNAQAEVAKHNPATKTLTKTTTELDKAVADADKTAGNTDLKDALDTVKAGKNSTEEEQNALKAAQEKLSAEDSPVKAQYEAFTKAQEEAAKSKTAEEIRTELEKNVTTAAETYRKTIKDIGGDLEKAYNARHDAHKVLTDEHVDVKNAIQAESLKKGVEKLKKAQGDNN